jgi:hypothetical protein
MVKNTQKLRSSHKANESITIRVDSSILRRLKMEAHQKQITVNTLITQVLTQHTNWHSHAGKAGFLTVRRSLVLKFLEKVSEQDIMSVAEYITKTETKDFVLLLRNEYNITSALDVLETWVSICGYSYRHEIKNNSMHSYVIHHDMGRKWSLYLAELYRSLFKEFGLEQVDFDIGDSVLSFVVENYIRNNNNNNNNINNRTSNSSNTRITLRQHRGSSSNYAQQRNLTRRQN